MPRIEFSLFAYHNKYLAISNRGLNAFTRAQGVLALPDTTLCLWHPTPCVWLIMLKRGYDCRSNEQNWFDIGLETPPEGGVVQGRVHGFVIRVNWPRTKRGKGGDLFDWERKAWKESLKGLYDMTWRLLQPRSFTTIWLSGNEACHIPAAAVCSSPATNFLPSHSSNLPHDLLGKNPRKLWIKSPREFTYQDAGLDFPLLKRFHTHVLKRKMEYGVECIVAGFAVRKGLVK